jgi:hypothetical protein
VPVSPVLPGQVARTPYMQGTGSPPASHSYLARRRAERQATNTSPGSSRSPSPTVQPINMGAGSWAARRRQQRAASPTSPPPSLAAARHAERTSAQLRGAAPAPHTLAAANRRERIAARGAAHDAAPLSLAARKHAWAQAEGIQEQHKSYAAARHAASSASRHPQPAPAAMSTQRPTAPHPHAQNAHIPTDRLPSPQRPHSPSQPLRHPHSAHAAAPPGLPQQRPQHGSPDLEAEAEDHVAPLGLVSASRRASYVLSSGGHLLPPPLSQQQPLAASPRGNEPATGAQAQHTESAEVQQRLDLAWGVDAGRSSALSVSAGGRGSSPHSSRPSRLSRTTGATETEQHVWHQQRAAATEAAATHSQGPQNVQSVSTHHSTKAEVPHPPSIGVATALRLLQGSMPAQARPQALKPVPAGGPPAALLGPLTSMQASATLSPLRVSVQQVLSGSVRLPGATTMQCKRPHVLVLPAGKRLVPQPDADAGMTTAAAAAAAAAAQNASFPGIVAQKPLASASKALTGATACTVSGCEKGLHAEADQAPDAATEKPGMSQTQAAALEVSGSPLLPEHGLVGLLTPSSVARKAQHDVVWRGCWDQEAVRQSDGGALAPNGVCGRKGDDHDDDNSSLPSEDTFHGDDGSAQLR